MRKVETKSENEESLIIQEYVSVILDIFGDFLRKADGMPPQNKNRTEVE
jgi:hypothetical protein